MSDRVSTIRFRVEGTQDIVSRSQELSKAIVRQQRELGNAVRQAMQGGPNGGDATKLAQQQADQLTRMHAMLDKERKAQFDKETEITDFHMRQVSNREKAEQAALDRMLARQSAAMNKAAQRQYADYARGAALDARADAIATSRGINRELDQAEMDSRAMGGPGMTPYGRASGKAKGGGGGGAGVNGALAGFGGKMIIAHAAGMAAGDIVGDEKGGREIGSVIGAAMFGGPEAAAAVAAIELVGAAFRSHKEAMDASRKASSEYRESLEQLSTTWSKFSTGQVSTTSFGKNIESEFERATAAALKSQRAMREVKEAGPTFTDLVGGALDGVESTAFHAKLAGGAAERNLQFGVSQIARRAAIAERAIDLSNRQQLLAQRVASYVPAGTPSMQKDIGRMDARQFAESIKQQNQLDEELRSADAGVTMATVVANSFGPNNNSFEAKIARQKMQDAIAAKNALPAQHQLQRDELAQAQAEEQDELQEQHNQQFLQQIYKTGAAVTAAKTDQYSREKALRRAADAEELRQAALQGAQMLALKKDEIDARLALESREEVERQSLRTNESRIKAGTDLYHRERALRDNRFDEELKQAKGTGNPAVVAAKEEEIANLKRAQDQDELFQAKIQLEDAQIRATKSGYEQQKALQEHAYAQELERAKGQSAAMVEITKQRIEAERAAEQRANQIRIEEAMSSFDPAAAKAKLARQEADWQAMGATPSQVKALKDEALTGNLRRQMQHEQVAIQEKMGKISQVQADVMNATIDNPMARAKGKDGDAVRKAIVDEAVMRDELRNIERHTVNVGQFGSTNAGRFMDIRAMNLDQKIDPVQLQKESLETARQTLMVLNRIANNNGVN